jgi:hypothetical protein
MLMSKGVTENARRFTSIANIRVDCPNLRQQLVDGLALGCATIYGGGLPPAPTHPLAAMLMSKVGEGGY